MTLVAEYWYIVIAMANRDMVQRLQKGERLGGQVEPGTNLQGFAVSRADWLQKQRGGKRETKKEKTGAEGMN